MSEGEYLEFNIAGSRQQLRGVHVNSSLGEPEADVRNANERNDLPEEDDEKHQTPKRQQLVTETGATLRAVRVKSDA